jgi:hypothetical protein
MKRLHFTRANNLNHLHDELLAAMPSLRPAPNARGELEAVIQVEGLKDDLWLTVPDSADATAIAATVQAHDPAATRTPTIGEERAQRISELLAIPRSDWTAAQLREIAQLTAQELIH